MDCVVCTDVLEHVNNLHEVFEELIRITKDVIYQYLMALITK